MSGIHSQKRLWHAGATAMFIAIIFSVGGCVTDGSTAISNGGGTLGGGDPCYVISNAGECRCPDRTCSPTCCPAAVGTGAASPASGGSR
jgi:hypothetical protein